MMIVPEAATMQDVGQWELLATAATKGFEMYQSKKSAKRDIKEPAPAPLAPTYEPPVAAAPVTSGPNWLIMGVVGGGFLLLAGTAAFFLLRKK